ncbi:MAG: glycosyltransferase [Bacteroidetes bacterium]|nr:glycosyltransferase [Bacteroidota bacterium]
MITVVCPLYNEEAYIKPLLDFYLSAAPAEKELLLIDGGSTDNTVAIIKEYQQKDSSIHLIHNPDKYVPFALNKAITASKGEPVIRLDAHTVYAPDYFTAVLEAFRKAERIL